MTMPAAVTNVFIVNVSKGCELKSDADGLDEERKLLEDRR